MAPSKLIDLNARRAARPPIASRPPCTRPNIVPFSGLGRADLAESLRANYGRPELAVEVKSSGLDSTAAIVQLHRAVASGEYKVNALKLAEILFDALFDGASPEDPEPPMAG
jgi:hypothetical protein